jgi:hypothetical protein
VVTVSVNRNAATFVVTQGMIQVTRNGQTFWVAEGAQQGQQGNQQGDTRTGREGTQDEETIIISTEENYTPPPGEVASLSQQGQQFSKTAAQSIPAEPFSGAPQQQSGSTGSTEGGDSGGSGGGSAPALPGGFGGGGGGGGTSGGGSIYSN